MEKFFKSFVAFLQKYYVVIVLLALVLAALSVPRMIGLFKNISTDPVDLLPSSFQSVQSLLQIRDKFNPKRRFAVIFESEDPESTKRALADLAPLLKQSPQVGEVYVKKLGYDFFDKHKLLYLDLKDLHEIRDRIDRKIQQEKLGGLFINFEDDSSSSELNFKDLEEKYASQYGEGSNEYYVSPNGKIFGLYIESKASNLDLSTETRFQDDVQKIAKNFNYKTYHPTMKMYFSGSTRVTEYRALLKDLKVSGTISGILIFLPLLFRFRKPRYVFLIFLPLLLGIPMGLALSSFWVPKLNVTTSFLFAILGGLGVETGIHLFSRYYENRRVNLSIFDSLLDLYVSLGPAILTAVASLVVTFLLMMFSKFRGFSEFGLISGLGLLVIFVMYFSFFPALLVFSEKLNWLKIKSQIQEFQIPFKFSPGFVKSVLLLFTLMTVFSILAIPRINFEYDSKKIRADNYELNLIKKKQRVTSGERVNNPAAVIVKNEQEAEALAESIKKLKSAKPHSIIDRSASLYSLVPKQQNEKMEVIRQIQDLLSDDTIKLVKNEKKKDLDRFKTALAETVPFTLQDVPPKLVESFSGNPNSPGSLFLVFAKPKLEMDNGLNAIRFADEVSNIEADGKVYHPSSDAVVFADVLKTMFRDSKKVLLISFLSVLFFVFIDFKSVKKTALVMASILAGVFWVMGILYLTGIKFNLYNMVMIPAIMGMSIDNSIHIYHRYEELGKGSLSKVLSSTGLSAMLASMTNSAGFFGLLFCSHGGLRSMGIVATIGLLTCLVTTLFYLPMGLQYLEGRSKKAENFFLNEEETS